MISTWYTLLCTCLLKVLIIAVGRMAAYRSWATSGKGRKLLLGLFDDNAPLVAFKFCSQDMIVLSILARLTHLHEHIMSIHGVFTVCPGTVPGTAVHTRFRANPFSKSRVCEFPHFSEFFAFAHTPRKIDFSRDCETPTARVSLEVYQHYTVVVYVYCVLVFRSQCCMRLSEGCGFEW